MRGGQRAVPEGAAVSEAAVTGSYNWKTVVEVPCASKLQADFLYPFCS